MAWERLERGIIIGMLRVDAEGYLVSLDFLGSTDNRPVTTVVGGAHLFESEIIESSAQLGAAQLLGDVATDDLYRSGYGHELPLSPPPLAFGSRDPQVPVLVWAPQKRGCAGSAFLSPHR